MHGLFNTLRRFTTDQNGMALILVTVMLPAIIGFALLVIDMSRVNNLHFDLQKGADAFALAAAAELDGAPDSWLRAERAMATLIDNRASFASDSNGASAAPITLTAGEPGGDSQCNAAGSISWCFLKALPASDASPITAAHFTDADPEVGQAETQFIRVRVTPARFDTIFPATFLSAVASNTMNVSAEAVAGFRSGVCDYTPVFICNPYELEPDDITLEVAATDQDIRRRQLLLRGSDHYMPGNFAFLESPLGNGASALEEMLASTKPLACYSQSGVDTEPGQNAGPVKGGLNARFGLTSEWAISDGPAKNVRAGIKNVECKSGTIKKFDWETDPENGVGLERDSCYPNCTSLDPGNVSDAGMMGNGEWDFERYWRVNHSPGGVERTVPEDLSSSSTRCEVYRYETEHEELREDASVGGETGVPACGITPVTTVDRRILYGAIIDCKAIEDSGVKFSGKLEDLPVRAFGSFFITEPIKDGKDIYAELVDITGRGGRGTLDNFLRDEAQLFR